MALIVGLGNIGAEYEGTRHNIGFHIVYTLAETLKIELLPGKGPFISGSGKHKGRKVVLVIPTTYMNRSGLAVSKALKTFDISLSDCLVVTDDINLPTGKIRLRPGGSSGGHNGLSDIIETLGSDLFPRLRFGIGNNFGKGRQADYVLSGFEDEEQDAVQLGTDRAHDAALCFIRNGIVPAMNTFN